MLSFMSSETKVIRSTGGLDLNESRNKWRHWSQLISSSNVILKVIMLMTKYFQFFHGIWVILFHGYIIHNLLLCLAHFVLLANVTIILNRRKLLQEYHITGSTQSQCVAVNKQKRKYKKKSQLCARGLFIRNSIPNNFYLKLFLMGFVFLVALSPK